MNKKTWYKKASLVILASMLVNFSVANIFPIANAESVANPNQTFTLSSSAEVFPEVDMSQNGTQIYVWKDSTVNSPSTTIYYQRYNNQGNAIDTSPLIGAVISSPAVVNTLSLSSDQNGNFVIAWDQDGRYIRGRAFKKNTSLAGLIASPIFEIGDVGSSISSPLPTVAITKNTPENTGNFIVAWNGNDNDQLGIYEQMYSIDFSTNDGTFTSSYSPTKTHNTAQLVNINETGNQLNPKASFAASQAAITWTDQADSKVWFRMVKTTSVGTGDPFFDAPYALANNASEPSIAGVLRTNTESTPPVSDIFYFAYLNDNDIYLKKISCTLSPSASCAPNNSLNSGNIAVRASTHTSTISNNRPSLAAFQNTNKLLKTGSVDKYSLDMLNVAWREHDSITNNYSIKAQNYKDNLAKTGTIFTVTPTGTNFLTPKNAMDEDGDYVIASNTGSTATIHRYSSELFKNSAEKLINTQNTNAQYGSTIAVANNGNYVIAYTTDENDAGDIFFKLYDKDHNLLKTKIANTSAGVQINPTAAFFTDDATSPYQGYFVIAWEGQGPADTYGIFYQIFDNSGIPISNQESRANTDSTCEPCDQSNVKVSASRYNTNSTMYQEFALTWDGIQDQDSDGGIGYFYNNLQINSGIALTGIINTNTSQVQKKPDIIMAPNNPAESQFVISWIDINTNEILVREGNISGNTLTLNVVKTVEANTPSTSVVDQSPSISGGMLNSEFHYIVNYQKTTNAGAFVTDYKIMAKSYSFGTQNSPQEITVASNSSPLSGSDLGFYSPRIIMDKTGGNALATWTKYTLNGNNPLYESFGIDDYEVMGQFYKYNNGLVSFGPAFRVNSYQSNTQNENAVGMNSESNYDDEKLAIVSWSNSGTSSRIDDNGIYTQILNYPLFVGAMPILSGAVSQSVDTVGKFLIVPQLLDFGNMNVNQTSSPVNTRNLGGVEVIDLDGTPLSLTVDATDLTLQSDNTKIISKENLKVQNCDESSPSVNELQNILGNINPDFNLEASTSCSGSYVDLSSSRTLGTKSSYATGQWAIFPRFTLTIPSTQNGQPTTNGIYGGTVTFTLA